MNMSPVARLKKTWSKVNTDKFEILEVRKPAHIADSCIDVHQWIEEFMLRCACMSSGLINICSV